MNRIDFKPSRQHLGIACVIAALAATTLTFLVFSAVVAIGAPGQERIAVAMKARQLAATTTVLAAAAPQGAGQAR